MKPTKTTIPRERAAWAADGSLYQQKIDGVFCALELDGFTLPGERVGGDFFAFDLLASPDGDLRGLGALDRWRILAAEWPRFASLGLQIVPHTWENPMGFLDTILAAGGEGAVRKRAASRYCDPMEACKRRETWQCLVSGITLETGSLDLVDPETGTDRGRVCVGERVCECQVGSLVKVEGFGLHASGRIREPRPCKDTPASWLVRF